MGLEIAVQQYGGGYFKDSGRTTGILTYKAVLNAEQREIAKKSWQDHKKSGGDHVTGGEATYTPLTIPPVDMEFIATRHFNVTTIARWFGVPPWKIADLKEGSTFNNIEQMGISFLQDTLAPIIASLENEFNNKLFTEEDKSNGYYIEFNMDAYLRADSIAKAESFRTAVQNAIKTPNQLRAMNNDNPLPGGDELYIQSNMIPVSMIKEFIGSQINGNGGEEGVV